MLLQAAKLRTPSETTSANLYQGAEIDFQLLSSFLQVSAQAAVLWSFASHFPIVCESFCVFCVRFLW